MIKQLLLLATALLFFPVSEVYAQLIIGAVDPGPYGNGSTITVPVSFPNNLSDLPPDNIFELYLSDATGNFIGQGTLLGTFRSFYTTGINGVIPANLIPGSGYKLRIRTTNPANDPTATVTDIPGTITINAVTNNPVTLTQENLSNLITGDHLGFCPAGEAGDNKTVKLRSNATGNTTTTIVVTNVATGNSTTYTELPTGLTITGLARGTYAVKVTASTLIGGQLIKSARTYTLHNNDIVVNIQDLGQSRGCIDGIGGMADISFGITVSGGGIINNDPQVIYRVSWGDGTSSDLTLADILNNSSRITHRYTSSSCGQDPIQGGNGTITNSFKATISALSPICGITASTTAYAQVFLKPVAEFETSTVIGCLNVDMVFNNTSSGGTRFDCSTRMDFTWYVDGVIAANQPTGNQPFIYTPTVAGRHVIKLEASNGISTCSPSTIEIPICVQRPPVARFTLPGATPVTICANSILTPTNTSDIDNTCTTDKNYRWVVDLVTGGARPDFAGGTSIRSETPQFRFETPGVYDLSLVVINPTCGEVVSPKQRIIVNTVPTATLSPDISLCSPGAYRFDNGDPTSPTYTTFSGTFNDLPNTYTWSITGGDYTISNGDLHTKYPIITFNEFKTYTVTLQHTNNCGTTPIATQVIRFIPSPTIDLGPDQAICFNEPATLNADINGDIVSSVWTGGNGGTFSAPNSRSTLYTPSAADKAANPRSVVLTLTVTTDLADPCKTISKSIKVDIKPEIKVTSAAELRICTGQALNYQPTAVPTGTTFTWTATGSSNARGFNNGSGTVLSDRLSTIDSDNPATVTYTILPKNDNCSGDPFTLVVTIDPLPVLTTTVTQPTICSGQQIAIRLASNLNGSTYRWTRTATTGTTNTVTGPNNFATSSAIINDRLTNNGTEQGSATYTITPYSANGCQGSPVTVIVYVDPALTVANAGPSEAICNENEYTLRGNHANVGTGTWTQVPKDGQSPITITDPNSENAVLSNLISGQTYTLRWTITGGACDPSISDVDITINTPTVAGSLGTVDPVVVCEGRNTGTITLTGNIGQVIRWEKSTDNGSNWISISNTTTTHNYTNITGSTRYRAVVKNGTCNALETNALLINVIPATTLATAGPDQFLCAETSTTITGSTPLNGDSGLWTLVSGDPTVEIVNPTSPTTSVNQLIPGATPYVFRWTITGQSPCNEEFAEIAVTSYLPLTNTINTTNLEVCNGSGIAITGSQPTGGNGVYNYTWESSTDGVNWMLLANETGQSLNYTLTTTLSFRRNVISNQCRLVSNVLRIVAQAPITGNTISENQTICEGRPVQKLTGNPPSGSNGNFSFQWQQRLDGGTWTDIVAATQVDYTPGALNLTTYFRRVVSTTTCNGAFSSISNVIVVTVNPNAFAKILYATDKGCAPFLIDSRNVRAETRPENNSEYIWYVDNIEVGRGPNFPPYTIENSNESVTIKLVTLSVFGCESAEDLHTFSTNQAVTASFNPTTANDCGPLSVNFVNTTLQTAGTTFKWNFGNGQTSNMTHPQPVTFLADPSGKDTTYTVTLYAITVCGIDSAKGTVFVKAAPKSVFSPSKVIGCSPLNVEFTNTSPGGTNTYYYDFGDGTTLTKNDKSPVNHQYNVTATRDFVVRMIAENSCGRDESQWTIRVSPQNITPELVVKVEEMEGCAPWTVNFYNNSIGATRFTYDFGDGSSILPTTNTNTVQHIYTRPGTFTVTMTAYNSCSEIPTTETVTVLPQPLTEFEADNTLGCPGLLVKFKNNTENGLSYNWDFGDGTPTSNEFEPTHTYTGDQEYYTVTLTATNTLGCTMSVSRNQYIHIVKPPVAAFNVNPSTLINIPDYTFRFEDESSNIPTIWQWDFGDGTGSALKDPSHTYLDTGTYKVTLKVLNQQGCFTSTFKNVTIKGVPGYLFVPNSFVPGNIQPELREFRAKGSGIASWRFSIFNKWGQLLWETTNLEEGRPVEGWDGTYKGEQLPQGVYYWKVDVQMVNGSEWKGMTYDSTVPKRTGAIHLIR